MGDVFGHLLPKWEISSFSLYQPAGRRFPHRRRITRCHIFQKLRGWNEGKSKGGANPRTKDRIIRNMILLSRYGKVDNRSIAIASRIERVHTKSKVEIFGYVGYEYTCTANRFFNQTSFVSYRYYGWKINISPISYEIRWFYLLSVLAVSLSLPVNSSRLECLIKQI